MSFVIYEHPNSGNKGIVQSACENCDYSNPDKATRCFRCWNTLYGNSPDEQEDAAAAILR